MTYLDWHDQPGYYRDVTRHFRPDAAILDVGCGSAWLANHFTNYVGIDNSPVALERARAAGRNVLEADLDQRLPFDDAQFEGVVLKDVLEHVRDPVAVVREIRRVLQPNSRVFASSPDAQRWVWDDYTHVRPFTRKAYRLLFEDQGFVVERVGYESVAPGTGVVSAWTRRKRRPRLFALLVLIPGVRRNVWILARKPI
jgi:SAM-dependent methyltransferase